MSSLLRSGKVITWFSPAESPALGQFSGNTWVARALRRPGHSSRTWWAGAVQGQGVPEPSPTGSHRPCNNTWGKSLPLFGPFFKQEATCSSGVWVAGPPRVDRLALQDMGLLWPLHIQPLSPLLRSPSSGQHACPGSDRWGNIRGAAGRTSPEMSPEQCLKPDLLAQSVEAHYVTCTLGA